MAKNSNRNRTAATVNKSSDTNTSAPAPATDPAVTTATDETTAADQTANTSVPGNNAAASDEANEAAVNNTSLDGTPVGVAQGNEDDAEVVEVSASMKRAELDGIATEAGLTNVSSYKDKATVVTAIERVRAGGNAEAIDAELAPVADSDEAAETVEVEVTGAFYDMKTQTNRGVGDKYKTTEERATELRGRKLVK